MDSLANLCYKLLTAQPAQLFALIPQHSDGYFKKSRDLQQPVMRTVHGVS